MTDPRPRLRPRFSLPAVALLALLMAACAGTSVDVDHDHDSSMDFTAIRTWDWLPGEQPDIPDPRVVDSIVDARMRRAVANEMASRQLTRVERAIPDVWVQYRIWVMPRTDFNPIRESNVRPIPDPPAQDSLDDVGLRIRMFDGFERTREVWSAEGRARLDLRVPSGRREQRTAAAVRKLLSFFPPK